MPIAKFFEDKVLRSYKHFLKLNSQIRKKWLKVWKT